MKIGIPKEIKIKEYRVGIFPSGVRISLLEPMSQIADLGWKNASLENTAISSGINVAVGFVTEQAVAKAHQMEYHELKSIIDNCPEFGGSV